MIKKRHVPNVLSILRILLVPFIIISIYVAAPTFMVFSFILFVLACITDAADGYVARKHGYITTFGAFFDSLADKILILSVFFVFADLALIPLWMPLLLMLREFIISGLRQVGSLKGEVLPANWAGKTKAVSHMIIGAAVLLLLTIQSFGHAITFLYPVAYYGTLFAVVISYISVVQFFLHHSRLLFGRSP